MENTKCEVTRLEIYYVKVPAGDEYAVEVSRELVGGYAKVVDIEHETTCDAPMGSIVRMIVDALTECGILAGEDVDG